MVLGWAGMGSAPEERRTGWWVVAGPQSSAPRPANGLEGCGDREWLGGAWGEQVERGRVGGGAQAAGGGMALRERLGEAGGGSDRVRAGRVGGDGALTVGAGGRGRRGGGGGAVEIQMVLGWAGMGAATEERRTGWRVVAGPQSPATRPANRLERLDPSRRARRREGEAGERCEVGGGAQAAG